jgi:hypothetical protein
MSFLMAAFLERVRDSGQFMLSYRLRQPFKEGRLSRARSRPALNEDPDSFLHANIFFTGSQRYGSNFS